MDVTDRTIEQVLVDVLQSGNFPLIIACSFLVGLIVGFVLASFYFVKVRYYCLENELKNTKKALLHIESERDMYKKKFENAQSQTEYSQGMEYARLAVESDTAPLPPY